MAVVFFFGKKKATQTPHLAYMKRLYKFSNYTK